MIAFAVGCASTPPASEGGGQPTERSSAPEEVAPAPVAPGPTGAEPTEEVEPAPGARIRPPATKESEPSSDYEVSPPLTDLQGLSPNQILSVVRAEQNRIKACYEQRLSQAPGLAGNVDIRWKIDSTGAVVEASLAKTTMNDPAVEGCIVDVVRRLQFPASTNGKASIVTFPFVFGKG